MVEPALAFTLGDGVSRIGGAHISVTRASAYGIAARAVLPENGVISVAAAKIVIPRAADDEIAAILALDHISIVLTLKPIERTEVLVRALVAVNLIRTLIAERPILTRAGANVIRPFAPADDVKSLFRADGVALVGSHNVIWPVGSLDERRDCDSSRDSYSE
jgi:hypothetical protein